MAFVVPFVASGGAGGQLTFVIKLRKLTHCTQLCCCSTMTTPAPRASARTPPQKQPAFAVEANKSFYQYMLLVSGMAFGVGELNLLKNGNFFDGRVVLGMSASVVFLLVLLMKKKRLTLRNERLFALARPYPHICADWLCVIGATALFSMLGYMVLNDISFFERGWELTRFSVMVGLNITLFSGGMYLLSLSASDERRTAQ
jgi:hypothetical protein